MITLIFDTETTDLFDYKLPADAPTQPRLCSIAASLVNDEGEVITTISHLVQPTNWSQQVLDDAHKPDRGFAINGLTIEKLELEGIPIADVLQSFDALVDRCNGIAGFNIAFDQKIMRAEQLFEDNLVRSVLIDQEPWFLAVDVCKALGHSNPSVAVGRLDQDEVTTLNISEGQGGPDRNIVSLCRGIHCRPKCREGVQSVIAYG